MRRSRRSTRGGVAAGALAVYPEVFGALSVATNYLTYGITHAPAVEPGLTKLLAGGDGRRASRRWGSARSRRSSRSCCCPVAVVTKIVLATLLALLYVSAPLAIALWPLPETSWLARTVAAIADRRAAVAGRLGAVLRAVRRDRARRRSRSSGSFGSELVKPWVSVAALFVAFKAPQLLARQAMLAGLTPSLGRHGGARAGVRARGDAAPAARAAPRASRAASAAARRRRRAGGVGAPSDLQAPRGAAAARRVLARPVGADHDAAASPRRCSAATSRRCRRSATIFVSIVGAGLPVAVSYGAMGLEFSVGAVRARAAWRYWREPRRYLAGAGRADRPATSCCADPAHGSRRHRGSRRPRRSCCGTSEPPRAAAAAGGGRAVRGRGDRSRGPAGDQRGRARARTCARRRRTRW